MSTSKNPNHQLMKYHLMIFLVYIALSFWCCTDKHVGYYSAGDFENVPKIDAHFHYNTTDLRFLAFADSINFRLVSPNVDAGRSIGEQFETASAIKSAHPDKFFFLGTFAADNFNDPGFPDQVIETIDVSMRAGASGIKIWKNIGMVLKDETDRYVMIDDPFFKPVLEHLQENGIPLLAHLGEPLNCWLPLEKMTLGSDRRYFGNNPRYHMYLHPEAPSYEDQVNARDNVLRLYPGLVFSGAHLASLEWSIDELAARFDSFPNLKADISARIGHLQHQSLTRHDSVREFMIRYQDRLIYGSDMSVSERNDDYKNTVAGLRRVWMDHWAYLATDSVLIVSDLGNAEVKGLKLPAGVVDKIYSGNALGFFR
jgi:hypothetical protein